MNRDQLRTYAEAGVKARLAAIQIEIDEMAREFPDLVKNGNGTIPAVAAVEYKPKKRDNSKALAARWAGHQKGGKTVTIKKRNVGNKPPKGVTHLLVRNYLEASPSGEATYGELARVVNLSESAIYWTVRKGQHASDFVVSDEGKVRLVA